MNPYDEIPYPGFPYSQTQPDRLAVMAHLLGLDPARPEKCRVLELGCGSGDSLISFAVALPGSSFLGVDLSAVAINKGNRILSELGLPNIRLEQCDLMDFQGTQFDYIVAHGLFSWVPAQVQQRILEIIRDCLAPQGVAFVSYNALPGGHIVSMLRDIMLYHAAGFESQREKVEQAYAIIEFLAGAQEKPNEYGRLMHEEWQRLSARVPEAVFHDELGSCTRPLFFHQFMERAAGHGLQYLSEARFEEMQAHNLKPHAARILLDYADDIIKREQYLDFMRGRRFRQTLLCHASVSVQRNISVGQISELLMGTRFRMQPPDPEWISGVPVRFEGPKEIVYSSTNPLITAALMCLIESWPVPLHFSSLWERSLEKLAAAGCKHSLDSPDQRIALAGGVLRFFGSSIVQFWASPPRIANRPGNRPAASPLARWQAREGDWVTTLLHDTIELDPLLRGLLRLLDGTRDRVSLATEMESAARSGQFTLQSSVESALEEGLTKLAQAAVLLE
jgi:methyltransferase-like protein/trans-aconitate methyltransferase